MVRLSYSAMTAYKECPKKYEYSRRLSKRIFNVNFFVGNCIHEGMRMTYEGVPNLFKAFSDYVNETIEALRKEHFFSPEDEQKMEEWRVIMLGMVFAYNNKYMSHIANTEHIKNEAEYLVDITPDVKFLIKIDNILKDKKTGKKFIHEIKTTRDLTANYVYNIQTDLQTACYYHLGQTIEDFRPDGIIYDVLQKPSIRVKKNEDYKAYLQRLQEYYENDPTQHLHMEFIEKPIISKEDLLYTITKVGKSIAADIAEGKFMKTFKGCTLCDFRKLCYGGDQPEDMIAFQVVERDENGNRIGI